jgi:hypothetical protein
MLFLSVACDRKAEEPAKEAAVTSAPVSISSVSSGIRGRASLGEKTLVEGALVRIYAQKPGAFGPFTGDAPVAEAKTDAEGKYGVELPPGRYVVEALKKKSGNTGMKPEEGDLWCLSAGSPVTVARDRWTINGFYLTKVPAEKRTASAKPRISGNLTFKGEPLEKAYLYFYTSVEGNFHGPAEVLQPVAKGSFSVALPPGTYYLVARKRAKGGAYGPIELGDKLNFYPGNPVRLGEGEEVKLEIHMAERLRSLEEDETTNKGLKVRLLDGEGKPLASYYVMAYTTPGRSGPPSATSALTGPGGETFINLPPEARYLRGRATLGGPLGENEAYVDGEVNPGEPLSESELVLRATKKK